MRRSTLTTHVFSILSDATTPTFSARRLVRFAAPAHGLRERLPRLGRLGRRLRRVGRYCFFAVIFCHHKTSNRLFRRLLLLLLLARAHQGLDAGERLLLAPDGLDGVHLAER